jgi:hypothetical protein
MTRGLLKVHDGRRNLMSKLASIRAENITEGLSSRPRSGPTRESIVGGSPSCPRSALTEEQVFRLLRCAIKDDDELVDQIIAQVYENIIAFDYKRAESVIELIVRRSVTAKWAFRALLKDMGTDTRAVGAPLPLPAAPQFTASPPGSGD